MCEQAITRNTAHPFCIRQYASFQDKYHLYFLFDLMSGGDLMDVLVAEAKVIKRRIPQGVLRQACFAPKVVPSPGRGELNRNSPDSASPKWRNPFKFGEEHRRLKGGGCKRWFSLKNKLREPSLPQVSRVGQSLIGIPQSEACRCQC